MTATSVLHRIARASVGVLVAGLVVGQAAPAAAAPMLTVSHSVAAFGAPTSDPGLDTDSGPDTDSGADTDSGSGIDLTPGAGADLTPGAGTDLTPGAGTDTSSGSATTGSWDTATAVVTDNAGKTTTLKARTVAYCISVGHSLTLSDGQDVPFEKMSRFEITRSDDLFASEGTADVSITLAGGGEVKGSFGSNCDIIGYSDIGRFSIYPQKLKSVEFKRDAGGSTGTEGSGTEGSGTEGTGTEGSGTEGGETSGDVAGTFEITGTEPTAINIVTDPAGPDKVASHYHVTLPWKGEFRAPADVSTLQVVVVGGGNTSCKITFGGKVVAERPDGGHCVYQRVK